MRQWLKKNWIYGLWLPLIWIFWSFFSSTTDVSQGDAPFFYAENFKELLQLPLTWNIHNYNFGQPQGLILWLYLPTALLSILHLLTSLSSDWLMRLFFYIPSVVLGLYGAWRFVSLYTSSRLGKIISAFFYIANTYFLVVIDGGQVGVALAFGFFPLCLYQLLCFLEKSTLIRWWVSLVCLFLLSNTDLRVWLLAIALGIFLPSSVPIFTRVKKLALIGFAVVALDLFWVLPFIQQLLSHQPELTRSEPSNFLKITDTFLLHQPHFPLNEFGQVVPPPFYWALMPVVLFGWLFKKTFPKQKSAIYFGVLFGVLTFLAKGESFPLGSLYSWALIHLPLATAFRDSSKFFIPLLLVSAVLVSITVQTIESSVSKLKIWINLLLFGFLLVLIYPALFHQLTGVLANKPISRDWTTVYQRVASHPEFSRTLWLGEVPQRAFRDYQHPALAGDELFKERPFASQIDGEYDLFNYLHSPVLDQWLKLLGIKYLGVSPNERKKQWMPKELKERAQFLDFVNSLPFLKKLSDKEQIPFYELPDPADHLIAQQKALLIFGGEEIFNQLFKIKSFSLINSGVLFAEQGLDLNSLNQIDPNTLLVLTSNKQTLPAQVIGTLNSHELISVDRATKSQWAKRQSDQYLHFKYELARNGLETKAFDYQQGIAFSTQKDESVTFQISARNSFYLGVRSQEATSSAGLKISVGGKDRIINHSQMDWDFIGPIDSGSQVIITNLGGTVALNGIEVLPASQYQASLQQSADFLKRFNVFELPNEETLLAGKLPTTLGTVTWKMISPTHYQISQLNNAPWLVFTDHFNTGWKLKYSSGTTTARPFYAMVNGFSLSNYQGGQIDLLFQPQEVVPIGLWGSGAALALLVTLSIVIYSKRNKHA